MKHYGKIISLIYSVCDKAIKEIERERKILAAENHRSDVLGVKFDNDEILADLRRDTGKIIDLKQIIKNL